MMCWTPSTASTMNHRIITGPNKAPTSAVPERWMANSRTRIAMVSGMTT